MLSYAQLANKPRIFRSLTGLSLSEFEKLFRSFEPAWQDYLYRHYITRSDRKRRYGGGRKAELTETADKLLFILFYFRQYPTQEVQGFLFGMGQPQAHEWVHRLTEVLNQALGEEQQLPERNPHHLEAVLSACPELEFIIDGTERRINRPKDPVKRDQHYSGKKKGTTVKNNVITERRKGGKVKYLSRTVEGKRHDKKLADDETYQFPDGSKLWQDTGFQGYGPENVTIFQPKKKPRGGELTPPEKERNRELSSQRIAVEHHLGGVKRSRIVHDTFRNRKEGYVDQVMETACGLHNFRVSHRQISVA
ncbi:MAG: transposase family protein [Leptolyngbyaceae bacterium]|nr:transposase family protein [Leptolyngbyaceae bacterium]